MSDREAVRAMWQDRWRSLALRFAKVSLTHDVGVLGIVERVDEVSTADVMLTTNHLIWPGVHGGVGRTVRWVDIIDMVGVSTRRRPRWLALNIAKARWGRVEVV